MALKQNGLKPNTTNILSDEFPVLKSPLDLSTQ